MSEHQPGGFFVPIITAFTALISWFWMVVSGQRKALEKINDRMAEHEKHVLENHPTTKQMKDALSAEIKPLYDKVQAIGDRVERIDDKMDKERDAELQRLRQMAKDRRES